MKTTALYASALALLANTAAAVPYPPNRPHVPTYLQHGDHYSPPSSSPSPSAASVAPAAHQTGGATYVVLLNNTDPNFTRADEILARVQLSPEHSDVTYVFNNSAFRGFVANMKSHCIDQLNAMTEVSYVEASSEVMSFATRDFATWGLQRISSQNSVAGNATNLEFTYTFNEQGNLAEGADVYIVDSGVRTDHIAFGGRARMGFSFDAANPLDDDGHGTHCAGTAAGNVIGVASNANIIGVKTLDGTGGGSLADSLAGMDWVVRNHEARRALPGFVGSVMSMSWGIKGTSEVLAEAVAAATSAGVHVVVAAGNSAADACTSSPSNSGGSGGPAISVGSINIKNTVSKFSNSGKCVDIYAPGEAVLSAWFDAPDTLHLLSGTSMACPHVTGIVAYIMGQRPDLAQDPAKMKQFLKDTALEGKISGAVFRGDTTILVNNGASNAGVDGILGSSKVKRDDAMVKILEREVERLQGVEPELRF